MPRRRVAEKREILPDPVYHNRLVAKFVNIMMWEGKKSLAEQIFYRSMGIIEGRMKTDPLAVFRQA
ncbi:MAG: 30S ribosomal protein S7, partial [candidate division NC10 bacterium]